MLNDNFIHFHQISQFFTFVNANLKFLCRILVSFKFWKFWSRSMKAMAKDKKVNITVTQFISYRINKCCE